MALKTFEQVPMPKNKITFKNGANGSVYVYRTIRAYRNDKGKPTSDEVAIGKKDSKTGMLIPNMRYYDYYESSEKPGIFAVQQIQDYGNYYVLFELAKESEVVDMLKDCFSDSWKEILCYAFYMVCQGNVMLYCNDWFETTYTLLDKPLTSQRSSDLFASIDINSRLDFFKKWVKVRCETEYLAYDVTSISSYSEGIDIVERGYNRDGEDLPQVNIGMFYGETSKLPVFYNVYNGSIIDKTHLQFMMEYTELLGIDKVKYVMDKGFISKDNLEYMENKRLPYIICIPNSQLEAKKIIDMVRSGIKTAANWIPEFEIYGVFLKTSLCGINVNAHVYYNQEKCADEEKSLFAKIEKLEKELIKLQGKKRSIRKYTDYFDLEKGEEPGITYERNYENIDEILSYAGYVIFITTDQNVTTKEVIDIYRNKDLIEKAFNNLKNELDFHRLRTHVNKTMDGKLFVAFIALIIRTALFSKIKSDKDTKKLTIEKVLIELKKIKLTTLFHDRRLFMPLTKLQKKILKATLNNEEAIFDDLISSKDQ